jgi:hypothetical protein
VAGEAAISAGDQADARHRQGGEASDAALPARPIWVYLAFAFTLLYLVIHLYWALGGTWGLPPLALRDGAVVRAVDWVVCAIMMIGALFVLALRRPIRGRSRSLALLVPIWIGAVVCLSHGVFGFITKALYLSGWHSAVNFPVVPGVSAATAAAKNHLSAVQDLVVFEPCFAIEGALLALAAWQFFRTPIARRRWSWSLLVGVVAIDVFGALLSLAHLHVAIS